MTINQIELFIVDRDPIFRLGLSVALEEFPDLVIIAQEDSVIATIGKLAQGIIPDILVIDLNLTDLHTDGLTLQEFYQILKKTYPRLPIFLLASDVNDQELKLLQNLGANGCIFKGNNIESIVYALRQVAEGHSYWQPRDTPDQHHGWIKTALIRLAQPGKQQINRDIEKIINQLQNKNLSPLNRLFLLGRKRELQTARWIANQIIQENDALATTQKPKTKSLPNTSSNVKIAPKLMLAVIDEDEVNAKVFNQVVTKISLGAINQTSFFLEIDILQPELKQELLYLILNNFGKALESIPIDAEIRSDLFIPELWQQYTINFLYDKYHQSMPIDREQMERILKQEINNMQNSLFCYIYLVEDLLQYLVKKQAINIDQVLYRPESPEAIDRAVFLLENLLINLANGIMQIVLNYFADVEELKYYFYDPNYRSSREIARFRNEISWQYRQQIYWEHPRNIFESRYRFFRLHNGTIETLYVYAPRSEELYQLKGLSWFTTIMLETRDALSPRLQSIFSLVGNSFVFILTQVIGKAIGLIAKGVLQGIGSTLQDVRNNKK